MGKKKNAIEVVKPLPEQLKDMIDAVEKAEKETKAKLKGVAFHRDSWTKNVKRAEDAISEDTDEKYIFEQLLEQALAYQDSYAHEASQHEETLASIKGHKASLAHAYSDLTRADEIASIKDALQSRLNNMNMADNSKAAVDTIKDDNIGDIDTMEAFDVDKIRLLIHNVQASLELNTELESVH